MTGVFSVLFLAELIVLSGMQIFYRRRNRTVVTKKIRHASVCALAGLLSVFVLFLFLLVDGKLDFEELAYENLQNIFEAYTFFFVDLTLLSVLSMSIEYTGASTLVTKIFLRFFFVLLCLDGLLPLSGSVLPFEALATDSLPPFFVHRTFVLFLCVCIIVVLSVRATRGPFFYSEKYIVPSVFVTATTIVFEFVIYKIKNPVYSLSIHVILFALIPALFFYLLEFYRPFFMRAHIEKLVFEELGTPVILFDNDSLLTLYNSEARKLFSLDSHYINKMNISGFLRRATGSQFRERSTSTVEEVTLTSPSGVTMVYKLDYIRLKNFRGKPIGTLMLFHNITELKKLYDIMEHTAMTNTLTGLASKTLLQKKIIEINLYRKFPCSVAVCNINGLRLINEGFGEDTGKAVIMHVAETLREQLRASDFCAYDDENFVIIMSGTNEKECEDVIKRISALLNSDKTFNFDISFVYGSATRQTPDTDMQIAVSQAYAAMLKSKMLGSSVIHESIIESLQKALRASSFETEQHSVRVSDLSMKLADRLDLSAEEKHRLALLALFHDIGKLSVPAAILGKPSALSESEQHIMQMHVINGFTIATSSKELSPIANDILCHHEHWDGSGYPNGHKGEKIPFLSRIVAVVDAFDVMTHDRPWQKAMSSESAIEEIINKSGSQFDPAVVDLFVEVMKK